MILNNKTLERLRNLINEETEYRSGPKLVQFFNELGFNESYGQGFPSRWKYTDDKLSEINGKPELDKCIKNLFNPINFIGQISVLDEFISNFNQYLAFDKWQILRNETEITFYLAPKVKLREDKSHLKEDEFLKYEFDDISLDKIGLDGTITEILNARFDEIKSCYSAEASLSVIFLSGSTLEGLLLGVALKHPKEFNQASYSPKSNDKKVKKLHEWTLSHLIDVAHEIGFLNLDVKKFSHILRDFRNYIHPYEQMSSNFSPDKHTAKICLQVLKAAIYQLQGKVHER
ncbi:MAG: hypothetical protein HQ509_03020 [Candidatus Marinimicrobia bacterium]|nr:hypothetical protein [Candidatus Neomarinimicrobiota bacterium]